MSLVQGYTSGLTCRSGCVRKQQGHRRQAPVCRAAGQASLVSWEELERIPLPTGYTLYQGGYPKSTPSAVLPSSPDSDTDLPVLLYRDTQCWCPFCERVWQALEEKGIPYATVLVDLQNKPQWYTELIPTGMTPAAKINGKLIWESLDILKALEEAFPETPLVPSNPDLHAELEGLYALADDLGRTGYRFLAGFALGSGGRPGSPPTDEEVAKLRGNFEAELEKLEAQLGKHGGPYMLGEFSLADIVAAPSLERFAANLPLARGFELRQNPRFPRLGDWYTAMDTRPAYQVVKSDDATHNLLIKKLFGVSLAHVPKVSKLTRAARKEAAGKIAANREAIVQDILKKSGIVRPSSSRYGGTITGVNGYPKGPSEKVVEAVSYALRRLCSYLTTGSPGPKPKDLEAAALGSAALAFFMNRASSPRDLTAAAAKELRLGCAEVLRDMYGG